jgi:hypothetical protein
MQESIILQSPKEPTPDGRGSNSLIMKKNSTIDSIIGNFSKVLESKNPTILMTPDQIRAKRADIIRDYRLSGHAILGLVREEIEFYDDFCNMTNKKPDVFSLEMDTPPDIFLPAFRVTLAFVFDDLATDEILYKLPWSQDILHGGLAGFIGGTGFGGQGDAENNPTESLYLVD